MLGGIVRVRIGITYIILITQKSVSLRKRQPRSHSQPCFRHVPQAHTLALFTFRLEAKRLAPPLTSQRSISQAANRRVRGGTALPTLSFAKESSDAVRNYMRRDLGGTFRVITCDKAG